MSRLWTGAKERVKEDLNKESEDITARGEAEEMDAPVGFRLMRDMTRKIHLLHIFPSYGVFSLGIMVALSREPPFFNVILFPCGIRGILACECKEAHIHKHEGDSRNKNEKAF